MDSEQKSLPGVDELQFRHAQPVEQSESPAALSCIGCKQAISDEYYQVQEKVVCPPCTAQIQAAQQAPPPRSLLRAALYGAGAALAGCTIYALVAILTGLEIGLISILVGIMVGKAIRHASRGLGGRKQQILAVVLTYFAITTSYIPVAIYQLRREAKTASSQKAATSVTNGGAANGGAASRAARKFSPAAIIVSLILLFAAAPFLSLASGQVSALITIVIIFFGLQRAWILTGRRDILVLGPYKAVAS